MAVLTAAAFVLGVTAAMTMGIATQDATSGQGRDVAAVPVPSGQVSANQRSANQGSTDQAPSTRAPAAAAYPADVIRVLDGDTFEARVRVWPGLEITTKVRLRGIDAPELRARCAEERVKAEAARDALSALLRQGRVGISHVSLDKYGGRVVADAATGLTGSISDAMLAGGHVRRYHGGRRQGWC